MTVHAYIPRVIQQAVAADVKCIEHGHLIDEPTARLVAEKGIRWSLQPFLNDQVKTAFGTDILFDDKLTKLSALSGFINPYPGRLGVVEPGALADLLLVNGNPLEDIKLIEDPARNFVAIMKDGGIYKNLLVHKVR